MRVWRGVRVAEGARLESVCAGKPVPWVRIPPSPFHLCRGARYFLAGSALFSVGGFRKNERFSTILPSQFGRDVSFSQNRGVGLPSFRPGGPHGRTTAATLRRLQPILGEFPLRIELAPASAGVIAAGPAGVISEEHQRDARRTSRRDPGRHDGRRQWNSLCASTPVRCCKPVSTYVRTWPLRGPKPVQRQRRATPFTRKSEAVDRAVFLATSVAIFAYVPHGLDSHALLSRSV